MTMTATTRTTNDPQESAPDYDPEMDYVMDVGCSTIQIPDQEE